MYSDPKPRQSSGLRVALSLAAALMVLTTPIGATEFFRLFPTFPGEQIFIQAVSDDGSTAVGELRRVENDVDVQEAFRWQPDGPTEGLGLGPAGNGSTAFAVSQDGEVVVGAYRDSALRWQPYRWTAATGMVSLATGATGAAGQANDVSADGSVVVGEYGVPPTLEDCGSPPCEIANPGTVRSFRWTESDGLVAQPLDLTDTQIMGAGAIGVSADGSVLASRQFRYFDDCVFVGAGAGCLSRGIALAERQALLSTPANAQLIDLEEGSVVQALSADGTQIVGQTPSGAFRWTANSGVEVLPLESNSPNDLSLASALSADGSVIGGNFGLLLGDQQADLTNLLINGAGVRAHGLNSAAIGGISSDGRVIAGTSGSFPDQIGYLAQLDAAPTAADAAQLPAIVADPAGVFSRALLSAALPLARSTQVGGPSSLFVTMINDGQAPMFGCAIALADPLPITVDYVPTEPPDNTITGPANELFELAPGEVQSFVVSLTPQTDFPSTTLTPIYQCGNSSQATLFRDLNELTLAASTTPSADILAVSRTATADGIALLDGNLQAAFAVASQNLGAATTGIRVEPVPTAGLAAFTPSVCETNPVTGDCLDTPADSLVVDFAAGQERTFGVFVQSSQAIEPLFAIRRVQLRFTEADGQVRANTSVAVVSE